METANFCLNLMIVSLIEIVTVMIRTGDITVTERDDALVCKHKGCLEIDAVDDCVECAISGWMKNAYEWNFESDTLTFLSDLPLIVKQNWRVMLSLDCGNDDVNKFNNTLFLFLKSDEICAFGNMTLVKSLLMRAHFREDIEFSIYWFADVKFVETLAEVLETAKSRDEAGYDTHESLINEQRDEMLKINREWLSSYGMME